MAATANNQSEIKLMQLLRNIDIPTTPIKINRASESEQKRATAKTWRPISPCLRTNEFCAPMASINENPRKKPVKKALSMC